MEFLVSDTLPGLEKLVTTALQENKLLHGDWKIMPNGSFAQAVAPADWRPVPPPKQLEQSNILVPQQGQRILG